MKEKNTLFAAIGIGTQNRSGDWLEVYYHPPFFALNLDQAQTLVKGLGGEGLNLCFDFKEGNQNKFKQARKSLQIAGVDDLTGLLQNLSGAKQPCVLTVVDLESEPQNVADIYLRLQLISHRVKKPHQINLSGLFGKLPNVAWTDKGAVDLTELPEKQFEARMKGEVLSVNSVDKFPKMTDYVVPKGVRIADTARVRLGAYIGEGTTVMHEGFVNFNAGTLGPNMIEGRISAGVVVGSGSDLGGGCSTMGTLSGGNKTIISVGENCLIGANAGVGIPLGDRCTIEAGLYVTASSKVLLLDKSGQTTETIKAMELSGKSDLLFRRNSVSGAIECLTNKSAIELNEELHVNN